LKQEILHWACQNKALILHRQCLVRSNASRKDRIWIVIVRIQKKEECTAPTAARPQGAAAGTGAGKEAQELVLDSEKR
jgi:hypothetical protein